MRKYKIDVKHRCIVWSEYFDAENLSIALDECTKRILKQYPDAVSWATKLRWEKDSAGNVLRKRRGF